MITSNVQEAAALTGVDSITSLAGMESAQQHTYAGRPAPLRSLLRLCRLVSKATVITPNLQEAAALTGVDSITSLAGMERAARKLHAHGAQTVLVKGGHLPDEPGVCIWLLSCLTCRLQSAMALTMPCS